MERAELARRAYVRAVELARSDSTPRAWGRLLTAARNLHDALPREPKLPAARAGARSQGAARPREQVKGRAGAAAPPARSKELAAEVERARALQERSRQLVAEAHRLSCELFGLVAAWRARCGDGDTKVPSPE